MITMTVSQHGAINLEKEHSVRRIINSTYISLDGVIQDPQVWPGNGIEPDGTALKDRSAPDFTAG